MSAPLAASSATLNRLSIYLRCLRELEADGRSTISSRKLSERLHISSAQIRKDLAHFGDFGIRGVGYEIAPLADRVHRLLGLDRKHRIVIVGVGNLGRALAGYVGSNDESFVVVAGVDIDPAKIGKRLGTAVVHHIDDLETAVRETGADLAVLTVPAASAGDCYQALVDAGIRGILNFSPVRLPDIPNVNVKNADLRTQLEEASFLLQHPVQPSKG
jgi:redox-sensing transcriptional repressor